MISIRGRIKRRPLNVWTIIRTPCCNVRKTNIQLLQQTEEAHCLGEIRLRRIALVDSKPPPVRNQMPVFLGNSRSQLSRCRTRRIRPIGNRVKGRKPHSNLQSRSDRAYSLHYFSQESRAILEASAVLPFSRMGAEKFVPQITVAMLNVHKAKTQFARHARSAVKLLNDFFDLRVGHHQIVRR